MRLFPFKDEMDTHVFDQFASRLHFLRLVFFDDMPVEPDGELDARAAHDLLLGFIFEKFGHVIVRFKAVQAVVIDVDLPKDPLFRHATEKPMWILAALGDKGEQIGVRDTRGTAATFGEREDVAVRDRGRVIEIFDQTKIEERHVRACRQGVAVAAEQSADLDSREELDAVTVFFFQATNMIVIPFEGLAVIGVQSGTLIVAKIGAGAPHAVIMIADPQLLYARRDRRFDDLFGFVLRAERIVRMRVKVLYHNRLLKNFFFIL